MKQRGQALTEFAVGVSAFSLLAVGTLTIAGFQEAQRRAIAGARHAAFESDLAQRTHGDHCAR